jgi:exonuclease VII small subunit
MSEIYTNYATVIETQKKANKEIIDRISNYKKIASQENTTSIEMELEDKIKNIKGFNNQLKDSYSNNKAPSYIFPEELERRQQEIQKLILDTEEIEKTYKSVKKDKYSYKGSKDDYQPTEEMKNMSNEELMQYQRQKINQQDERLDDIAMDVKKGRVLAKEAGTILKEQNKQLDQLQEDMDRLDSRFQRGIKRFENYVAQQSGCCIIIVLIIELVIAFLTFFLLGIE